LQICGARCLKNNNQVALAVRRMSTHFHVSKQSK
jgi:hypothetical protein